MRWPFFVVVLLVATSAFAQRFEEIAPSLDEVTLKKGDPFVEVLVSGVVDSDCFDVHEFHVERVDEENLTRIVPRFRRSNPDKACKGVPVHFQEKATDLDPAHPASYKLAIMGHRGWHHRELPLPPGLPVPAKPTEAKAAEPKPTEKKP